MTYVPDVDGVGIGVAIGEGAEDRNNWRISSEEILGHLNAWQKIKQKIWLTKSILRYWSRNITHCTKKKNSTTLSYNEGYFSGRPNRRQDYLANTEAFRK